MKRTAVVLSFLTLAVLVFAPAGFAQAGAPAAKPPINPTTLVIAAGFGVAQVVQVGVTQLEIVLINAQ